MKKPRKFNLKTFIVGGLRQLSYKYPPKNEAKKLARVERGVYKCVSCGGHFKEVDIRIDHINPVVNIKDGFTNWDDYVKGMFPTVEGFQILCSPCHDVKSLTERELRKYYRKLRKEALTDDEEDDKVEE